MEKPTDTFQSCNDRLCHRGFMCKAAGHFISLVEEELRSINHDGQFDPENLTENDRVYISLRAGRVALMDYRDGLARSCNKPSDGSCEPEVAEIRGDERMLSSLYAGIETNTPLSTVLGRHRKLSVDQVSS